MATITTNSHGNYLNTPRMQYISVQPFQNDIFRYTTSLNPQTFVTTGSLTSLATLGLATASNCPANRILRENGKKLYPSGLIVANSTEVPGPYPGVTTYMVGVYDSQTGLSGYIDPNSAAFTVYNSDKPNYVPRGVDPNTGAVDQGPPVITLGSVTAGTTVTAGTSVTAATTVNAGTLLGYGGSGYSGVQSIVQDTSKATAVTVNGPVVNITTANSQLLANTTTSFTLTNSAITVNDTLVCVHLSGGTIGTYYVSGTVTGAGSATIFIRNMTAANLTEQPVIRVYVLGS